jgi:putative SOS response-associated peptidase YedK
MCGRYYRRSDKQCIADAFEIGKLPPGFELPPDYNIAPSTFQPVIRTDPETGERELTMMRWGLVPAKIAAPDSFKTFSATNARAQSRYWTSRSDADHSVILVAWFRWTDSTNGYSAPVCLSRHLSNRENTDYLATSKRLRRRLPNLKRGRVRSINSKCLMALLTL